MYYGNDHIQAAGRRRRKKRNINVECECQVAGANNWISDLPCGCGGQQRPSRKEKHTNCDSCICHQLKDLRPGTFILPVVEGEIIPAQFLSFDPKTCCAYFDVLGFIPTVIDCRKITALLFLPTGYTLADVPLPASSPYAMLADIEQQ